ncbi:MAG: hypothetical protein CMI17_06810 [Opitutaceae bacterium]|nr:hypothetical protein [Opitutaceae bacterium]
MKRSDRLIKVFFFLWLVCFVCSFSLPFLLEASGDGLTRGLNRLGELMGWSLGATVFALLGFISGIGERARDIAAPPGSTEDPPSYKLPSSSL